MIRISVAHSAAWVHEWSTQRLHKAGIFRGSLNYHKYSRFYLIKSAVLKIVQRSPEYPWHKVFSLIILAHVLFIWAGDIYMVIHISMIIS